MALDTYANLQASIANFLNRADLTTTIPDFITLAESQINRRLLLDGPVRRMMVRADATITTEFAAVPTDFMGVKDIYLTETYVQQLKFLLPDQLLAKKTGQYTLTGCPLCFSVVGGEFQFYPAPNTTNSPPDSFPAELTYWAKIPSLSDTVTTNWLLDNHPDCYLYGSLLQSAPYLRDDARIQVWGNAFETILSDIVQADKQERNATYMDVNTVSGGTFDGPSNGSYGYNGYFPGV